MPEQATYATYQRKQLKTNAERLARYRLKRKTTDMSFEEAVEYYQTKIKQTFLPYIQLKSSTNEQPFRLFIEKKLIAQKTTGNFTSYGLSSTNTVPEF